MYAWTMLTEFNSQSVTRVKNTMAFYYAHTFFHTPFNACHVYTWPCFVVASPELLEELHHAASSKLS